jgi:hypothetical protein
MNIGELVAKGGAFFLKKKLSAVQQVFDAATNAEKSAFQASVSGASPAGAALIAGQTTAIQTAYLELPEWRKIDFGDAVRVPPPGLPALPMAISKLEPHRITATPDDAISAAIAYYTELGQYHPGVYYVQPSKGSNSNNGTSPATPFATLEHAVRNANSGSRVVCLEDMTSDVIDMRSSDASQSGGIQFKWIDANGFKVKITPPGPALKTQSFVADGTYTACYGATIAVINLSRVNSVLRTDIKDADGFDTVLPGYSSLSDLNTAGYGWYFDYTAKKLWVAFYGANVNIYKPILRALYSHLYDDYRILVYSGQIGMSGVWLDGVYFQQVDNAGTPGRRSAIWLHNCVSSNSPTKGADLTQTGWFVASDTTFHKSRYDAVNGYTYSAAGQGLILTLRCKFNYSGDRDIFPLDGTFQGISAHGGCHHVSWGSEFVGNNAPGIADTVEAGSNNVTWLLGCYLGSQADANQNISLGTGAGGVRAGWFDSCISRGAKGADLVIGSGGTVKAYNTPLAVVSGGSVTAYNPAAPA